MNRALLAALSACFVVVIAAYVVLSLEGQDPTGLISAVVTLLGVTGLAAHIETRTKAQDATLNKIQKQTNGVLDQRIRDGVAAVLDERDKAAATVKPKAKRAKSDT